MRNAFSFVEWPLPVQNADFYERLNIVHKNAIAFKNSMSAVMAAKVCELLSRLGLDSVIDATSAKCFAKHSCTFSNLPVWQKAVYYRGSRMLRCELSYFNFIPQVIIDSYDGEFYATICVDPDKFNVDNVEKIFDSMADEILTLIG